DFVVGSGSEEIHEEITKSRVVADAKLIKVDRVIRDLDDRSGILLERYLKIGMSRLWGDEGEHCGQSRRDKQGAMEPETHGILLGTLAKLSTTKQRGAK